MSKIRKYKGNTWANMVKNSQKRVHAKWTQQQISYFITNEMMVPEYVYKVIPYKTYRKQDRK